MTAPFSLKFVRNLIYSVIYYLNPNKTRGTVVAGTETPVTAE
jgi:hypothetical protein